ncbi:MAG: NAD-dependent epimerase/dehydratase family protein [Chloroflexi bacterium]|nr:NAD-dependent epimerase/dehydratase family protein [Chloroflexota bacterium]
MITILGATGFVGSALAQRLEQMRADVVKLSRPDFDLTLPETFQKIPSNTDVLIHAAGHVGGAPRDEIIWQVNVESTYHLVRHLNAHCRPALVVYLSSGAVFGPQPQTISGASPVRPDSLYGLSKLLAERICETMLNAKVVFLRLFFPFGPGQKLPRLIPSLIRRIAQGQSVEINTGTHPDLL